MYTRLILTLVIPFVFTSVKAQKITLDTIYFNQKNEVVPKSDQTYATYEVRSLDKKGRIEGSSTRYSKSGSIIEITYYSRNVRNGEYRRFKRGQVLISGSYLEGKKVGAWTTFDLTGNILQVTNYGLNGEIEEIISDFEWNISSIEEDRNNGTVIVETKPVFDGGMSGWGRFLRNNLKYPVEAKRQGYQGDVFVDFIVLKSGVVVNPVVTRSPNQELSQEALRVMRRSPRWLPGTLNGQPIDSEMTIRIRFSLK